MVDSYITQYLPQVGLLIYLLIAIAIFLEGEAVIFGVMFLAYEGLLNPYLSVLTIILAVLFTDISSYYIGYYGPQYLPRIAHYYEQIVNPMDGKLHRMSFTTFLISKFTYGFHRAVLIRSGMLHLPFKKFFQINLITSTIWIITIAALAFAAWKSVSYVEAALQNLGIALLIGIIILLLGSHAVSFFSKRALISNKSQ